jgi:hypothetical protein
MPTTTEDRIFEPKREEGPCPKIWKQAAISGQGHCLSQEHYSGKEHPVLADKKIFQNGGR